MSEARHAADDAAVGRYEQAIAAAAADEEKVLRIVALALAALTGAARGDAGDIVLARSSDFLKFLKGESQ